MSGDEPHVEQILLLDLAGRGLAPPPCRARADRPLRCCMKTGTDTLYMETGMERRLLCWMTITDHEPSLSIMSATPIFHRPRSKPAAGCSRSRGISPAAAGSTESLPKMRGVEIAFAGRSNVGKSSLINALTGRNALVRDLAHARPHPGAGVLRRRPGAHPGRHAGLRLCRRRPRTRSGPGPS